MDIVTHGLSGALLGSALASDETQRLPLMIVGALAGMAPDLDFLTGLRGKVAAWRYHRVLLHGLPTVPMQALILFHLARIGVGSDTVSGILLLALISAALLIHLTLDTLTSFGTALLFPLSRRRFSTCSHFIVDPIVVIVLLAGLLPQTTAAAQLGLLALGGQILFILAWRQVLLRAARREAARSGHEASGTRLEPGPFAPLHWRVIAQTADGQHALSSIGLPGARALTWQTICSNVKPSDREQAARLPLVSAFLATADAPRWTWLRADGDDRYLVVEDIKWWLHSPFRPLAFLIPWANNSPDGEPRQQAMFWRGTPPSRANPPSRSCSIATHPTPP